MCDLDKRISMCDLKKRIIRMCDLKKRIICMCDPKKCSKVSSHLNVNHKALLITKHIF